jgi:Family of unknown function (DUF6982)
MGETNRVVARFLDGTTIKGTTEDFFPNRPMFHLAPLGNPRSQEVRCAQLKAVFFVKDFAGDSAREDLPGYTAGIGPSLGKKIAVQFKDGEIICGYTLSYSTDRSGFFLLPADEGGNNLRVYVLKHATKKVAVGPAADELAKQQRPNAA